MVVVPGLKAAALDIIEIRQGLSDRCGELCTRDETQSSEVKRMIQSPMGGHGRTSAGLHAINAIKKEKFQRKTRHWAGFLKNAAYIA